MIKIFIGFAIGVFSTICIFPMAETSLSKVFSLDDNVHTSNIINSEPPGNIHNPNRFYFATEVMTAITVAKIRGVNDQASDYAVRLISNLIDKEPKLQLFVRDKLSNGITNGEALEIFEKYYSVQG